MGQYLSYVREGFPQKSQFSVDDIPNLAGKVMIVTGANTGIGKETAKALLQHNAKVYIAARSRDKADMAIQELKSETGKEGIFLKLDLANLESVKTAADDFLSKERDLHVLFNNAGVMAPPVAETGITVDGYDLQFGTNVLGHFYLTKLLLPALLNGAKSSNDGKARVVNISSSLASIYGGPTDFNTLKDGPARRRKSTIALYGQSKFGNILFAAELARRYGDQGIVSIAVNPGNLDSYIKSHHSALERKLLGLILYPVAYGALTQLWAGTAAECATMNGKFLKPWARVGEPYAFAEDTQLASDLWEWCEDQVTNI